MSSFYDCYRQTLTLSKSNVLNQVFIGVATKGQLLKEKTSKSQVDGCTFSITGRKTQHCERGL